MAESPRLFLIDGSSQMVPRLPRDARRGFSHGGKTTHAVYVFVNMLRKLIEDHRPSTSPPRSTSPGRRSVDELATDYKANRAPMPPDLAEQIPWVHEACEALGVPILTSKRYEADDVIGTLATKAPRRGFDVAIVTGDKDFFQLVHDGLKVYNPKDDGTWFDADGVKEKFGVRPIAGRGRARADGRLDRQHQGRARHRRERCARSDRRPRRSGERCWPHAAEVAEQALPRRAAQPPTMRGRAASWPASAPTFPLSSIPRRCAIAGTIARPSASSSSPGSDSVARHGERADGETIGKDYARGRDRLTRSRALASS